jgi:solute:Na+ symporter, SSS family
MERMENSFQRADYIVLAGFFVVMLGVGLLYARRMHSLQDFFGGGRHVPWWLAGASLYMTTFSAFTFVAYSALAYKSGFVAVSIWWFSIPGCLLSARFLAARWRRAATTSPLEYLETRYGPVLRQCFSWFGVPLIVLDDALKLFVIGSMVSVSLGGISHAWAIVVCGVVIVLYTLLGGLWAVLVTDFVQFVVMALAVVTMLPLAYYAAGGLKPILDAAPSSAFQISAGDYTWPWLLSFAVILALTFAVKWPYVQRYYVVRSSKEAHRVGYMVGALTLIAPPLLFFPAFAAWSFLPGVENANDIYPLLCRQLLPAGMMGIVIAAMFSATMSMLSSDYNAVASVITNDVIKRLALPKASDRTLVIVARLSTLVAGILAMILAVLFTRADTLEDLVKIMAKLFAVLLPPVALPMLAGLLTRRASNAGAIAGFAAGATCGIVAYALSYENVWGYLPEAFHLFCINLFSIDEALHELAPSALTYQEIGAHLSKVQYMTWITLLPTGGAMALFSLLMPDNATRREEIDRFLGGLTKTSKPAPQSMESDEDVALALRIIGGICLFLGVLLVGASLLTAGWAEARVSICAGMVLAVGGLVALAVVTKRRVA